MTARGDFDPSVATFTIGSGIYVSKLDASGNFVWAKKMSSGTSSYGYGIALDGAGNVYTTGTFWGTSDFDPGAGTYNLGDLNGSGDVFISKLDGAGNFVWAKGLHGGAGSGNAIALDGSGNVYTTGKFNGTTDFDPSAGTFTVTSIGMDDIFVSKLDGAGNFSMAKIMSGTFNESGNSIVVDGACKIYVTGDFQGTVDFDPDAGVVNLISAGSADAFVVKLNCAPTGINETNNFFDNGLSIYPNPSTGKFSLALSKEINGGANMTIYDIIGKIVATEKISSSANQIDFNIQTKGMYFVTIESEGKRITKKIVVE
jgi:hypothetical protein